MLPRLQSLLEIARETWIPELLKVSNYHPPSCCTAQPQTYVPGNKVVNQGCWVFANWKGRGVWIWIKRLSHECRWPWFFFLHFSVHLWRLLAPCLTGNWHRREVLVLTAEKSWKRTQQEQIFPKSLRHACFLPPSTTFFSPLYILTNTYLVISLYLVRILPCFFLAKL